MTLREAQELAHNKYLNARRMLNLVNSPIFNEVVEAGRADIFVSRMIQSGDCQTLEDLCNDIHVKGDPAVMTIRELRKLAKDKKIAYYGRLTRVQLLQALKD